MVESDTLWGVYNPGLVPGCQRALRTKGLLEVSKMVAGKAHGHKSTLLLLSLLSTLKSVAEFTGGSVMCW